MSSTEPINAPKSVIGDSSTDPATIVETFVQNNWGFFRSGLAHINNLLKKEKLTDDDKITIIVVQLVLLINDAVEKADSATQLIEDIHVKVAGCIFDKYDIDQHLSVQGGLIENVKASECFHESLKFMTFLRQCLISARVQDFRNRCFASCS